MNKPDRQTPYAPPAQATEHGQGTLDEARALFEQMAGEAMRLSDVEHEEARARGPLTRALLALTIAAALLAVATMVYGIYHFPDAPIRPTAGGYVGKGGKPHTREDFEAFVLWGKAMFIVFPAVFVLGFAFGVTEPVQRRKRKSVGATPVRRG